MSFGTYNFPSFKQKSKELNRLIKQAEVGWKIEQPILQNAGLDRGMKVLDLACGPGITSTYIAQLVDTGTVLGLDLNPDFITLANQYKETYQINNVYFQEGDAYQLNLPQKDYDFTYARFLFQHLEHPQNIMTNVWQHLKKDGTFCIMDIDDTWLTIYPTPPSFETLKQQAADAQKVKGGDRFVGRKLAYYMKKAGFEDVQTTVLTVSMDDLGVKTFLDITTAFKLEQITQLTNATNFDLSTIYEFCENHPVTGLVGVFIVTGKKGND